MTEFVVPEGVWLMIRGPVLHNDDKASVCPSALVRGREYRPRSRPLGVDRDFHTASIAAEKAIPRPDLDWAFPSEKTV